MCTMQLFLGALGGWAVHRVARDGGHHDHAQKAGGTGDWERPGIGCAGAKRFCCRQILGLGNGGVATVAG